VIRAANVPKFRDSRGKSVDLRLLILCAVIALTGVFAINVGMAAQYTVFSAVNSGVVVTISLLVVLVFLQVSDPSWRSLGIRTLSLRTRYGWLAVVLLAIFACMVFTRVILIMAGIG